MFYRENIAYYSVIAYNVKLFSHRTHVRIYRNYLSLIRPPMPAHSQMILDSSPLISVSFPEGILHLVPPVLSSPPAPSTPTAVMTPTPMVTTLVVAKHVHPWSSVMSAKSPRSIQIHTSSNLSRIFGFFHLSAGTVAHFLHCIFESLSAVLWKPENPMRF